MPYFSLDEKLNAIHRYQDGTEGVKSIAKSLGINHEALRMWIRQYEYHGVKAFEKTYTAYSTAYKLDVLNYMNENGTSPNEAAVIFNISSPGIIRKWRSQYHEHGLDALKSKKKGRLPVTDKNKKITKKQEPTEGSVEALQAEIERLRMENAYFKKVECLSSKQGKITKQDKSQIVYELRLEFTVNALLELAEIPRSTFYYWVKQLDKPDPDVELKLLIQSIYEEHKGLYGYRRIRDELLNRDYRVNHKKVQRIMKELGLKSIVRMKKYRSYKGTVGKIAPNVLDRNFKAQKPNEKWVTDITELKLFGEKLYLSPVLDLYNGEIITYTVASRPTYSLVSEMLNQAFKRLSEEDELLLHSDQGWHYQMKQYQHALKKKGITQSMSRKGNCYDNAVIENFFGIMKSEFLYLNEFESVDHFKLELARYMNYYNHKRIKARLKGMSPVQYRTHAQQVA
ncbi:IS3 family transposase [Paenibacillus montanisoli]|uniref:IS3 family transposase n=1 Tax=Paenibacillus montanisoli TaxID=2081970 RepID=A0A328U1G3_9BACL|nr:IS3 family transposase [Paenibacillus montanisoli]RAP75281.1 IS3 family transposase [Paenibacillus montanisoli]